MKAPKHTPEIAAGLREITAWAEWFAAAHEQRLRDLDLPADQFENELADVVSVGKAVAERMRADFLARHSR
jgi:hypothetical protein